MAGDLALAPVKAADRPPRTTAGEWDGEALLAALQNMPEVGSAGPNAAEVALVLRELVVSQRAIQRFNSEMGWPAEAQHSFAGLSRDLVDNAESWLRQAHGLSWHKASDARSVVEARLAAAFEAASRGATIAEVETALPEEMPICRARTAYVRGEAALRNRMRKRAVQDFTWFTHVASHVTVGHRRLGQIALAKGDLIQASRFFEAAVAIPNQRWTNADVSDHAPLLVGRIGQRLEIYRFRGSLYAVDRTPDFLGLAVVAGRLIQVYDTPFYRLWRRVRPRRETIDRLLSPGFRRKYKRLVRSLTKALAYALFRMSQRYPRFAPTLRRLAAWFFASGGQKEAAPDAPGRLMSILLRLCRPFRRTWAGRVFRRIQARIPSLSGRSTMRALAIRSQLFILRYIFRAKELPNEMRADSVGELIQRVGAINARA